MRNKVFFFILFFGFITSVFADISKCVVGRNPSSENSCGTPSELMSLKGPAKNFSRVCEKIVASDVACQKVAVDKRMSCSSKAENEIFSSAKLSEKSFKCLKGFIWDSMVELGNFVIDLIKSLVEYEVNSYTAMLKFLADADYREKTINSAKGSFSQAGKLGKAFLNTSALYFAREFPKNLLNNYFDPILALSQTLAKPLVDFIAKASEAIIAEYIPQYQCMNGAAKLNTICKLAGDFIMPPVFVIGFMKKGAMGLKLLAKSHIEKIAKLKVEFALLNETSKTTIVPEAAKEAKITALLLTLSRGVRVLGVEEAKVKTSVPLKKFVFSPKVDAKFTKPAAELNTKELAAISRQAQALDAATHPINIAADKAAESMISVVQKEAAQTSTRLLKANKEGDIPVYDVAIVGIGGLHGEVAASVIQSYAPEAKMIGVDLGNGTSRTFDNDFFHLNSSENPLKGDTPLPYSANQVKDLMPDIIGNVYPRARALANAKDFGLGALDMDILLNNKVLSCVQGNDGLWLVTMETGIQFKTRKLVKATGYGKTLDAFLDKKSQELIATTTAEFMKGNMNGAVVSFDDFRVQSEKLKTLGKPIDRALDDLDIVVVGAKDGGAVVVENITQVPVKGKRFWIGQEGSTGDAYIANTENKKRYADLAPRIDKGEIVPIKAHMTSVKHIIDESGLKKVELTYKMSDGSEKKVVADMVIMSTGYEKVTDFATGAQPRYFANNFDPELAGVWDVTKAREASYQAAHPEKFAATASGYYSVGVDASTGTGLFSLSKGGGATTSVAKEIAQDVKIIKPLYAVTKEEGNIVSETFKRSAQITKNVSESKIALAGMKTKLLKTSRSFHFDGPLTIIIKPTGPNISIKI